MLKLHSTANKNTGKIRYYMQSPDFTNFSYATKTMRISQTDFKNYLKESKRIDQYTSGNKTFYNLY